MKRIGALGPGGIPGVAFHLLQQWETLQPSCVLLFLYILTASRGCLPHHFAKSRSGFFFGEPPFPDSLNAERRLGWIVPDTAPRPGQSEVSASYTCCCSFLPLDLRYFTNLPCPILQSRFAVKDNFKVLFDAWWAHWVNGTEYLTLICCKTFDRE